MTANKRATDPDWIDPDDAPDLSEAPWNETLAKTPVRRGRPKADTTKVSTTIRLDADIVEHFRSGGDGWQSRINAALRKVVAAERH